MDGCCVSNHEIIVHIKPHKSDHKPHCELLDLVWSSHRQIITRDPLVVIIHLIVDPSRMTVRTNIYITLLPGCSIHLKVTLPPCSIFNAIFPKSIIDTCVLTDASFQCRQLSMWQWLMSITIHQVFIADVMHPIYHMNLLGTGFTFKFLIAAQYKIALNRFRSHAWFLIVVNTFEYHFSKILH